MNDNDRNKEFGDKFVKSFNQKCHSHFEFVDIFVEKNCILNRHMDYENSTHKMYHYGCSYSFLIQHNDEIYRMNFIMCNRSKVDQFMNSGRSGSKMLLVGKEHCLHFNFFFTY